jgi:hypothetical protein
VREIRGIDTCIELSQVIIPSSIETLRGFRRCQSLRVVSFDARRQVKQNQGFRTNHPFLLSDDRDIKSSRCRVLLAAFVDANGYRKRNPDASEAFSIE